MITSQDDGQYVHIPVYGLPASLLQTEHRVVRAIALMQQHAGLNRDRRREMLGGAPGPSPEWHFDSGISKADKAVLSYFLSPSERFKSFRSVATRKPETYSKAHQNSYARAIDYQLLQAYEPTCFALKLDEAVMANVCEEWPRIRDRSSTAGGPSFPIAAFMLWPRLVEDLSRWEQLSEPRKLQIGHAVFALSSIGLTGWFIDRAMSLCPGLKGELSALSVSSYLSKSEREKLLDPLDERAHERQTSAVSCSADSAERISSGPPWQPLVRQLNDLTEELKAAPTKEAVGELRALAEQLSAFASQLPQREVPVVERIVQRLQALISYLSGLSRDAEFEWLDVQLIAQIDSRWQLEIIERWTAEQLAELEIDAGDALQRSREASDVYSLASQAVQGYRKEVDRTAVEVSSAKSFGEKAVAKRAHAEAQKNELEARGATLSTQEALIDAASPFHSPFDHSENYVRRLELRTKEVPAQPEPSTSPPPPIATPEPIADLPIVAADSLQKPVPVTPSGGTRLGENDSEVITVHLGELTEALSPVAEPSPEPELPIRGEPAPAPAPKAQPQQQLVALSAESTDPAGESKGQARASLTGYNDAAGQACQPIWRLLSAGQPALAFHAAQWVQSAYADIRVPPPELLAAVALAEELVLPDGTLQAALSEYLAALDPEDFSVESPPAWHAALNLLLAAATLRPMVLAPSSGASSVAAYLHQDGHYPALYALVQKLRELSSRLVGFRVEPTAFRLARGEAAVRSDLEALQHTAGDWLRVQAPAYTIKFAAATSVWRQWLRPGGEIDALVAPVIHNRIADAERVRALLTAMSDPDHVHKLIHDTDRRVLKRTKGEAIHAGALDHLRRNVEEALSLPRQWLALVDLLGGRGDRLRDLLEQVNKTIRESQEAVVRELVSAPNRDEWSLVRGGQTQALRAVQGLIALFDAGSNLLEGEPQPLEVLGRSLLRVPSMSVAEGWAVESSPQDALAKLAGFEESMPENSVAFGERLTRGDLLGAEMMVESGLVDAETAQLRPERDRWKTVLRREMAECRRSVEVGSAYGYLPDADRGQIESQLGRWEAQIDELRRFDVILAQIKSIRDRVVTARELMAQAVRVALRDIALTPDMSAAVADIEKSLAEGDIATANELVHWLAQGKPTPMELDEEPAEGFDHFFPEGMKCIDAWLEPQRRDAVEQALAQGPDIPGLNVARIDSARRDQSAKMFSDWCDIKSQQAAEELRLRRLLTGLGFTVKELKRAEKVSGRELWTLDAEPVGDRHICPLPMYGSSAGGRYRVLCVWGRPTEDELLQWVGESSNRPALVLYFGRMTERKWRDLSRLTRSKRRSLALLDETLLTYLCCATGSRLRAWFDACMPFSYSSPYDASAGLVPPEMFYGRGEELEAVGGLNGRCFIYGGRQLGKTALLKRAEQSFHRPEHGHYARWIDLRAEGIGVSLTANEIWVTLHDKLRQLQVIDAKHPAPLPGKRQGVDLLIRAIREFIDANSDRRLLLLLDEADRFFEQDGRNDFEETRRLKQLMDDTQRRFKVVFAGLHNVLRMTERPNHPLAHFGEPIEIGPLREGKEVREAADLIRRPMAAAGFAFESRRLVIRILAQTNYYPSLIQLYCSHLLRHMLGQVVDRQRQGGPRYLVTDRDIEQVYSSDALRDEIRAKFRLTLQLDPRYEVLAYTIALDLLRDRYSQSEGMPWQTIRQGGALHWWAEGFRDTSELDFRVLLDEMVGLGVLRRLPSGRYVLRNPNVLLLLGTQEEIEAVLNKDREPAIEFESSSFRPPLSRTPSAPGRNTFTYQQLSRLLQRANDITVVTGTNAAGIGSVTSSLEDYLGSSTGLVVMNDCADRQAFGKALHLALADRPKDQVTIFVIPETLPWTDLWLQEAKERLQRLHSASKFASVIFVAEPATLWRLLDDEAQVDEGEQPWMSLLPWRDGFLRHWLEERQLQLEPEDRRRLSEATGLWPAAISEIAGDCTERRVLRERMNPTNDGDAVLALEEAWVGQFGLSVAEPAMVIDVLARLGEPVAAEDLALVAETSLERVAKSLRWGELLGLTHREGAGYWTVDALVKKLLVKASA